MKTVHGSFPSGLVAYEHEPYTQKNVLEYSGTYYVV
ncbi:MAG: plasmid segregation actin-type ATPase ParM, partial [Flavonifractor plautii]